MRQLDTDVCIELIVIHLIVMAMLLVVKVDAPVFLNLDKTDLKGHLRGFMINHGVSRGTLFPC